MCECIDPFFAAFFCALAMARLCDRLPLPSPSDAFTLSGSSPAAIRDVDSRIASNSATNSSTSFSGTPLSSARRCTRGAARGRTGIVACILYRYMHFPFVCFVLQNPSFLAKAFFDDSHNFAIFEMTQMRPLLGGRLIAIDAIRWQGSYTAMARIIRPVVVPAHTHNTVILTFNGRPPPATMVISIS